MNQTVYPYAQGDLLTHPQTYQYSAYQGEPFLDAWRVNRSAVLASHAGYGAPAAPPPPKTASLSAETLERHLEGLLAGIMAGDMRQQAFRARLAAWIGKFEARRQLFTAYGADLKPAVRDIAPLRLHLRYAEVMAAAYDAGAGLPGLNVLLKVMDTLIACSDVLVPEEFARLSGLIRRERTLVETLAARLNAPLPETGDSREHLPAGPAEFPGTAPDAKRHLGDAVLLAADTPRSNAYAQALARRNISVQTGILFTPHEDTKAGQKADPPQGAWPDAPFPLPDLGLPLRDSLAQVCGHVRDITANHVNDPAILRALSEYAPRLVIYSGYGSQIVGEALLSSGIDFLHVHAGWLPEFRGSTTIYYHLLATERCGASAILLRSQLDAGPVLARKWFPRPPAGLDIDYLYDSAIRADLLADVLRARAEHEIPPAPEAQTGQGTMYYIIHPVLKHLARLSCREY